MFFDLPDRLDEYMRCLNRVGRGGKAKILYSKDDSLTKSKSLTFLMSNKQVIPDTLTPEAAANNGWGDDMKDVTGDVSEFSKVESNKQAILNMPTQEAATNNVWSDDTKEIVGDALDFSKVEFGFFPDFSKVESIADLPTQQDVNQGKHST